MELEFDLEAFGEALKECGFAEEEIVAILADPMLTHIYYKAYLNMQMDVWTAKHADDCVRAQEEETYDKETVSDLIGW